MADYERALVEIERIIAQGGEEALEQVVTYLNEEFPHYSWVGIYLLQGDGLVLGPWRGLGATEHTRIKLGQGVCGAAAASRRTEIVPDVSRDKRYLACFPSTRSEIVVPIIESDRVLGEIDIDSDRLDAFSTEDKDFLEKVAARLAPLLRPDRGRQGTMGAGIPRASPE